MTETAALYSGYTLGSYELLVPIAEGATAQVWAAQAAGSGADGKIVAIKVLLADGSADVDTESMFLDEARLVSRIRHPNVAAVIDVGEQGDALYIVMEWVEGEPLQVVLREARGTRVPLPLALRVVALAAAGLHAAHEVCDEAGQPVGLVHRDVSPTNVLVGYDGAVKVIDFGVAKAASNMQRTRIGQIKGKVPYMAPEQLGGDKVDRRVDVFALGIVLYQLVTGKHPFRAENEFATMARIRDKDPAASPRTLVPDLPPALEAVMLKALAKQRDERYPSMLELWRALEQAAPAPPGVDEALGHFMRTLLSQRAARRQDAIRRAVQALAERPRTAEQGRPERSSGVRRLGALASPEALAAARADLSAGGAARSTGPQPPGPSTPGYTAGPVDLPDGMRPRRSQATLIAAGIVLVLVLILAIVAAATASSGSGDTTKHAF